MKKMKITRVLVWALPLVTPFALQGQEGITFTDEDAVAETARQRENYRKIDSDEIEANVKRPLLTPMFIQNIVKEMISWRSWMRKNLMSAAFVEDPESYQSAVGSWCLNGYVLVEDMLNGVELKKNGGDPTRLVDMYKAINNYAANVSGDGVNSLNHMYGAGFPKAWKPYAWARGIVNVNPRTLEELHAVAFFIMLQKVCLSINREYIRCQTLPARKMSDEAFFYQSNKWLKWAGRSHNARGFNFETMLGISSSGAYVIDQGVLSQVRAMRKWAAPLQGERASKLRADILGFNEKFLVPLRKTLKATSDYMQNGGGAEITVNINGFTKLVMTDSDLAEALVADYKKTWERFQELCDKSKPLGGVLAIDQDQYRHIVAAARTEGWSDGDRDLYDLCYKAMRGLCYMAMEIAIRKDAP